MESKNKVLTAVIALVALVVGIFVGIGMQGGGGFQGKLALTQDASQGCDEYKKLLFEGMLTPTLGSSEEAQKVVDGCQTKFPEFWNSSPSISECKGLKMRLDFYGVTDFSEFLKKNGVSFSNTSFCAYNYPYLWYGTDINENECWAYKSFFDAGELTPFLFNDDSKAKVVQETCKQKVVGWAPAINIDQATCDQYKIYLDQNNLSGMIANGGADAQIAFSCQAQYPKLWYTLAGVNVSIYTCLEYKKYFDQGVLTDMVNAGQADGNVAPQCDALYKYIWQGVTHAECDEFANWKKQGILTPNMAGDWDKAQSAVEACKYYGYGDLFN